MAYFDPCTDLMIGPLPWAILLAAGAVALGLIVGALAHIDTMCQIRYFSSMARTTVNISITPELDAFLQSRVSSGRYQTTSEVVREALRLLERQENDRDNALQQLKTKLGRGVAQAERGELLDGDEVFNELRELIAERRRAKQKTGKR